MYIFDTTHNKTVIYMPLIQPSLKIQTITQCQVYGYKDFHGQIPNNYKLL